MKKIIYLVLVAIAAVLIIIGVIPRFIDWNSYKSLASEHVKEALGRDLTIAGDLHIMLLPTPHLSLGDVRLSNMQGAKEPEMLKVEEVDVYVALWPLLHKQVEISQVSLVKPIINLEKKANGQANWDFPSLQKTKPTEDNSQEEGSETPPIQLNRLVIEEAKITYLEGASVQEITDLTVTLEAEDLMQGPYNAAGKLKTYGEELAFAFDVGSMAQKSAIPIKSTLRHKTHSLEFAGDANLDQMAVKGQVIAVLNPLPFAIPNNPFTENVQVKGQLNYVQAGETLTLDDLTLTSGKVQATGQARFNLGKMMSYMVSLKGLPGRTDFILQGALGTEKTSGFQGKVQLTSPQLKDFLAWLKVDTRTVPPRVLAPLSLSTTFAVQSSENVRVSGLKLSAGSAQLSGDIHYRGNSADLNVSTPNLSDLMALGGVKSEHTIGEAHANGHISGDLGNLNLDATLGLGGGSFKLKGSADVIGVPKFNMHADINHPNLNQLLKLFGTDVAGFVLGGVKLQGNFSGTPAAVTFSNLKGALSPRQSTMTFAGDGRMTFNGTPKLTGALRLGNVDLGLLLSEVSGAGKGMKATASTGGVFDFLIPSLSTPAQAAASRWSTEPLDLSGMKAVNAELNLAADSLKWQQYLFKNVSSKMTLNGGNFSLSNLKSQIFEGTMVGFADVSAANTPSMKMQISLQNTSLQNLLSQTADINMKGGRLNMDLNLATQGGSELDLISALSGSISLDARDGVVEGFDLEGLSKSIGMLTNPAAFVDLFRNFMSKGSTKFDSLKGRFNIQKGIANAQDFLLTSPSGNGIMTGFIDLPKWFMDIQAEFKLLQPEALPPFGMTLKGPLDNPKRSFQANIFQNFVIRNFTNLIDTVTGGKITAPIKALIPGLGGGAATEKTEESTSPVPNPADVVKDVFEGIFGN